MIARRDLPGSDDARAVTIVTADKTNYAEADRDASIAAGPGPVTDPARSGADGTGYTAGGRSLGKPREICKRGDEKQAVSSGVGDRSENTPKRVGGLLRVKYAPSGVDPEKLDKSDLGLYRRALRWQRLRAVQHLMPEQRTADCFRKRHKPKVEVNYSRSVKRAHYSGLIVCASVWACPVCAAKITERRRAELENANTDGLSKFMVTYTLQHSREDKLSKLIADLSDGLREMKNSRGYKNLIGDLQIVGTVTGAEVTVSNVNGWHPHKHALSFSKLSQSVIKADELQDELSRLFIAAMQKRGRYVSAVYGVNVQTDNVMNTYLAKIGDEKQSWSLAAEIAKSPVKTGRDENHFHPFELLDMYLSKNIAAGRLFIEYAIAMKGKKQLFYSKGLRDILGLNVELSDQEIAEQQEQDAYLFALINPDQWKIILKHEKRGQLLEVASTGNYSLFSAWMRAIGCYNPK